ncbi:phosphatase PAP2 family protein [Pullulanibacillus sp. KACC 23026]|uniref:phosphatase PAP2 family protein n=1 Tax=Pullulanibacillus sp. KACC 23026 TaxID=3028315 RepID=UPI0023B1D09D|nr:phosphatase PAP2 family protein [Pullulanibacillus sp. KACC 23026]WEG12584.1 phosphatase PAP2 family protein [Pullulanibacillus sp. KACC 23026]
MRSPQLNRHFISLIIFSLLFLALSLLYEQPFLSQINLTLQRLIYNYSNGAYLDFFTRMTRLGSAPLYIMVSLILMLGLSLMKNYKGLIFVPINLIGSALLNVLLKHLLLKPRPEVEHLVYAGSYSFPSGHSMNAMVFYGFLAFLLMEFLGPIWAKWLTLLIAALFILLIGMSRVYLGVHYPLDIIGGYSAGLAWLSLIIFIYKQIES